MSDGVEANTYEFRAEIRQLLNILIHSLYTDREIFLRELISNASDALNRLRIEQLTNTDVLDADAELKITLTTDPDNNTLTISDTGVGMTHDEFIVNLGTIAHSGAAAFLQKLQESKQGDGASDLIGKFGVGFYSVFMVADEVSVVSRSYDPEATAWRWRSSGDETYALEPAERAHRGTDIIIKLKDDAKEFAQGYRLRNIIRQHSNFVAFPIYIDDDEAPANEQTALWRQPASKISDEDANAFYKSLTLDFEPPLLRVHLTTDVPVQIYAMLFVPGKAERGMLSTRTEDGLKLYARKVLIDEYYKDALPQYLRFVQGVIDSEDLPLNVSRENVQSTPMMRRISRAVTNKLIDELAKMALNRKEDYARLWRNFGLYLKEGVASDNDNREKLIPLLRFRTTRTVDDEMIAMAEYVGRMHPKQKEIYYILGEDPQSVRHSPHLDALTRRGLEVIYMTDAYDSFMLLGLEEVEGFRMRNIADADLELPDVDIKDEGTQGETLSDERTDTLVARFKTQLGERVSDVRTTDVLVGSPVRLVDPEGAINQQMQRVYRILEREYEIPKKVLELNPRHALLHRIADSEADDPLVAALIEQLFESALLVEGLHPNPAAMASRIQMLMEKAAGI